MGVVVLGSLNQDLHLAVERHPTSGETVMSGDIVRRFGGKGANQAIAAARAGVPTRFVGNVGEDAAGQEYRTRLERFGVDTSRLRTVGDAPTGTAIIYNDRDGENMIVVAPGANHRIGPEDLDRLDDLTEDDVLLMPLESPLEVVSAAARLGHERGARVIVNLAPFAPLPPDVLALCSPVVVNEHEAELLTAAGLRVEDLLTTLGARGARWGDLAVPAEKVVPVDSTGAGDAFCGALAAALARGASRETALSRATTAASTTVLHHGAQPAMPQG